MLARFAHAWDMLQDLDCNDCDAELQRERGCGVAPQVPHWEGSNNLGMRPWTLGYFYEQCQQRMLKPDDEAADQFYMLGGRAGSVAILGVPWSCCPRSYLRRDLPGYSATAHRVVDHALKLYSMGKSAGLQAVARLPLIPSTADLIDLCERASNWRTNQKIQDIRSKAGANTAVSGA